MLTAPQSPWQNPYVERLIGSIRRDCLDHVIVLNESGLRRILRSYFEYYERSRTHLSLSKDAPSWTADSAGGGRTDCCDSFKSAACTIATNELLPEPSGSERILLSVARVCPWTISSGRARKNRRCFGSSKRSSTSRNTPNGVFGRDTWLNGSRKSAVGHGGPDDLNLE